MTINEEAIFLDIASRTTAEKQNYVTTMSDRIVIVSVIFLMIKLDKFGTYPKKLLLIALD